MNKQTVAASFSAIGIIFILATAFSILSSNIGTFLATVFFALSGIAWAFWPKNKLEGEK
ncbi:MAG: hypothetical protein JXB07_05670 [Anaerolineae bacterium]|nr:hypothetical protein [Anaerolineae bacterium]